MAQRRMFSPDIVESEEFLSMPISSQALYFHLGMHADDDGFVQPQKVMRLINSTTDDLKVLLAKRFLLTFESGVVVVKHWLIHNMIRADRYHETRFKLEKSTLSVKENKAYTDKNIVGLHSGNQMATEVRLGKVRLGKVRKDTSPKGEAESEYSEEFISFWKEYPKKTGKGEAYRIWKKLKVSASLSEKIIASVESHTQSKDWKKEDGRFIPLPATFLNQRRWEDEETETPVSSKYAHL